MKAPPHTPPTDQAGNCLEMYQCNMWKQGFNWNLLFLFLLWARLYIFLCAHKASLQIFELNIVIFSCFFLFVVNLCPLFIYLFIIYFVYFCIFWLLRRINWLYVADCKFLLTPQVLFLKMLLFLLALLFANRLYLWFCIQKETFYVPQL